MGQKTAFYPKIAVSTMTNCASFLDDGAPAALQKLAGLGIQNVEISQHIQFDDSTIPQFVASKRTAGVGVCAISAQFDGTVKSPMPTLFWQGQPLKTWSLERDLTALCAVCRRLDCRYLRFAGFPGTALRTGAEVRAYMQSLEALCLRLKAQGIGLCVHNHADEFMRVEGKWLLQWALELAPTLLVEADVLNALKCGVTPERLFALCRGRVPLVHLQDYAVFPTDDWLKPDYRYAALGCGNLDIAAVCRAAAAAGAEYLIIEQAQFYGRDPYACIADSARTLRVCLEEMQNGARPAGRFL